MNWLLIVVIALMFLMAVVGIHRGFVRMVYPFAAMVLSVVILVFLAPYLRDTLQKHTEIDERIEARIYEALRPEFTSDQPLSEQLDRLPLPKSLLDSVKGSVDETASHTLDAAVHAVSSRFTGIILGAMVYVGGFLVIYILLLLFGRVLKLAAKLPVIRQADKILGLLLGLLMAVLLTDLFFLLLTSLSHTPFGQKMMRMTAESSILSFLYDMNFLARFF